MAERSVKFVVVFILFFNGEIFSQKKVQKINFQENNNPLISQVIVNKERFDFLQKKAAIFFEKNIHIQPVSSILPERFYFNCLGFFCRKEIQIEKITALPFRFRLGSLAYVNYLEQKPNSFKPSP